MTIQSRGLVLALALVACFGLGVRCRANAQPIGTTFTGSMTGEGYYNAEFRLETGGEMVQATPEHAQVSITIWFTRDGSGNIIDGPCTVTALSVDTSVLPAADVLVSLDAVSPCDLLNGRMDVINGVGTAQLTSVCDGYCPSGFFPQGSSTLPIAVDFNGTELNLFGGLITGVVKVTSVTPGGASLDISLPVALEAS